MSGQGIKVEIQAITREERETARGQDVSQGMDDDMSGVMRTGAQMKDRKQLRRGVDDQPQPQDAGMAAQPGAQFIQLQMWEPEVAEETFVQGLCMFSSASQPGRDRSLSKAEDPLCSRRIQPLGQRRQYHCDLVRRGFQTIERRVMPGSKRGMAGLTPMCVVCQEGKKPAIFLTTNQA